jgi:hypothetical protein
MEKKVSRLKFTVGVKFARVRGGWFIGFGFHWFCVMFYRNCGPEIFFFERSMRWTGVVISWKPNAQARPGDLIWSKSKKWGVYAT